MRRTLAERNWIDWLVKVRIVVITFLLVIELAITELTSTNVNQRLFVGVILGWYAVSLLFLWAASGKQLRSMRLAEAQVVSDLVFATAVIYVTGGIDTSFNFLYPLIIILASALLTETGAYLTAGFSFMMFGSILELTYFELIPSFGISHTDPKTLQAIILINLFAYSTIAYLSNRLTSRLRQVNVELADQRGAFEDLQALHEIVVDAILGGLITTDAEGAIKLVNPAAMRLLGREGDALEGVNVDSLFAEPLPRPANGEPAARLEIEARTPGGEKRIFGFSVSPLQLPGDASESRSAPPIGYVYTFSDLTEVRRLEHELQLRDRLAAVGRMAAGIAHEIRNPLSSIAGSVKVLSGIATLTDDQRALVEIVNSESERLNRIITDFLTYSRDRRYEMEPVELRSKLEDTLTLLANSAGGVEIVREFAVDEAWMLGDAGKLQQVFWNLCENALRAVTNSAKRGERSLTVRLTGEDDEWRVSFLDTGAGIPPHLNEKIFEPFQSAFEGGTGLGLAIVYQIVQAHKARIYVRSEQGVGTEFTLFFRKLPAQALPQHREHAIAGEAS